MLLLSLMTLFAGPLLFQWLSRSHRVARILDRVIVVDSVLCHQIEAALLR